MSTVAELFGDDSAHQRVYLNRMIGHRGAQVSHLIPAGADMATTPCERCGRKPVKGWLWLGVRTADQRAMAAALPLCEAKGKSV